MNRKSPAGKRWRQKPIRAFVVLALFCAGLMPGMVRDVTGDEFKLTPSLAVKEEYNDNILYAWPDTQKDFITTISPGLVLTDRTERMELSLLARLDRRLYSSHSELNATDQYYEGTCKYALTPRLTFFGKAVYSRDTKTDRDIEATGLLFTSVRRDRQNYTISGDYLLSEKTMATFNYDYLNDKYYSGSYTDLEANTFSLGFIRDMSGVLESTKARFNLVYAKYETSIKVDNYEATVGIDHALNEKWNLLLDGGGRYTRSRFVDIQRTLTPPYLKETEEKNSGWGTVGQLVLTYNGERHSAKISANLDILPASGRTGPTERTSFVFKLNKRFTHEFYGTLSGGYYLNRSRQGEPLTRKIDEDTMRISPGIRYEFDKDKAIEASYIYNRTKYNISGIIARQNVFYVRFRIQHDLFE